MKDGGENGVENKYDNWLVYEHYIEVGVEIKIMQQQ